MGKGVGSITMGIWVSNSCRGNNSGNFMDRGNGESVFVNRGNREGNFTSGVFVKNGLESSLGLNTFR